MVDWFYLEMSSDQSRANPVRVLVPGVFDLFHYGHALTFQRAKALFEDCHVIAGVHGDDATRKYKGDIVMNAMERAAVVKHCRHVDFVIEDVPWQIHLDFLDLHKIDFVVGADDLWGRDGVDPMKSVKDAERFIYLPRVAGVSSTEILARVVSQYDRFLKRNLSVPNDRRIQRSPRILGVEAMKMLGTPSMVGGYLRRFGERFISKWQVLANLKSLMIRSSHRPKGIRPDLTDSGSDEDVDEELKQRALRLCRMYIPGWTSVKHTELNVSCISGGLTNKLYKCSISKVVSDRLDAYHMTERVPSDVVLRLYGKDTELFFDRETEHMVFRHFSDSRLGPHLYAFFDGGRLEQFMEARTLGPDDLEQFSVRIGEQVAKIHCLQMNLEKRHGMFDSFVHWYSQASKVVLDDPQKQAIIAKIDFDEVKRDWDELVEVLTGLNSPVVFCHNDLLGANMMYNDTKDQLYFIDYEYGSYNFRGFDFGNHFCEWTIDYRVEQHPYYKITNSKFPNMDQQRVLLSAYIQMLQERGADVSICGETLTVETLSREGCLFSLASHLLWAMWSVIQAANSDIEFGYEEYALSRIAAFKELRERFMIPYLKGEPMKL